MNGIEIKEIRLKLGLSQADFSDAVGVRINTLSRWENGRSKPSRLAIDKLKKLEKQAAA